MMKIILLFDRALKKIKNIYQKKCFKARTRCHHDNFILVGDITLINNNVSIGKDVTIYPGCMFFGDGIISIGNGVDIGKDCVIYSSLQNGGVSIGDNTHIAAQCYIIDQDHGTKRNTLIQNQKNTVAPVKIGKDCWLGADVTVLKGSVIGDGAIIGAKSLVKGEIPPFSVCVGTPCKVIRYREV